MENFSNDQIALMADIGEKAPLELDAEKRKLVEALITAGMIQPSRENDSDVAPYELTAKAQRFLSERGATLNEA